MNKPIIFSGQILKAAKRITLADLLQSPSFQHWIISAMFNGVRFGEQGADPSLHADQLLQLQVYKITALIPGRVRVSAFRTTSEMVRNSQEQRDSQ